MMIERDLYQDLKGSLMSESTCLFFARIFFHCNSKIVTRKISSSLGSFTERNIFTFGALKQYHECKI